MFYARIGVRDARSSNMAVHAEHPPGSTLFNIATPIIAAILALILAVVVVLTTK